MAAASDSATKAGPKENSGIERRIAKRHSCDGFAEIAVPGHGSLFCGEIGNLSETGCHVKTRTRRNLTRAAEVELRFTVKSDRFSVLARAALVRSGMGVGFEFSAIEPAMYKSLLQLIEALSAAEVASPESVEATQDPTY